MILIRLLKQGENVFCWLRCLHVSERGSQGLFLWFLLNLNLDQEDNLFNVCHTWESVFPICPKPSNQWESQWVCWMSLTRISTFFLMFGNVVKRCLSLLTYYLLHELRTSLTCRLFQNVHLLVDLRTQQISK